MNTQEIWFPEYGIEWPSHGCLTDGFQEQPCTVIAYATAGHASVPAVEQSFESHPGSTLPPPSGQLMEDEEPLGPAGVRQLVIETSGPVTPDDYPNLYTILDPGQAIPALMLQAKELGFTVSYSLHGQNSAERITL